MTHLRATGDHELVERYVEVEEWFRLCELGLGINQGPSIFWTLQNLEKINRRNQRTLAKPENKEQQSAAERRNRWRALFYSRQRTGQLEAA